jgi:hypothetical protein
MYYQIKIQRNQTGFLISSESQGKEKVIKVDREVVSEMLSEAGVEKIKDEHPDTYIDSLNVNDELSIILTRPEYRQIEYRFNVK